MPDRISVLFVTHNYPRHAGDFSGVFLHTLAKRLQRENVTVTALAPHDAGAPEEETRDGIRIIRVRYASDEQETFAYRGNMHHQLKSFRGLLRFRSLSKSMSQRGIELAQREDFDLIAGHWVIPGGRIASQIAGSVGQPLVLHSHGTDIRLLANLAPARWFAADSIKRASAWTVVSSYLQTLARSAMPDSAEKIKILPLPNDETMFYKDESIRREPNLLVAVTRYTQQKRPKILIESCRILKSRAVDFRLELYATGELEEQIRQQITESGLTENISMSPPVSQERLREVYNRARAVILNSVDEGFGLTLVEGALCGALPVAVSSGGIVDIIANNETGLLARPDDPESLADTFQMALTDSPQIEDLAKRAHQSALERFSGEAVAYRYAELYRQAVSCESRSS